MTRISSALPFTLPSFGANRPVRVQAGGAPMRDNFFSCSGALPQMAGHDTRPPAPRCVAGWDASLSVVGGDCFGGLHLSTHAGCVGRQVEMCSIAVVAWHGKDRLSGFAVERTAAASGCCRRLQAGEHLRSDAIDCTGDGPQAKTGLACFETACGLCAGMLGKEWNTGTGEAA